MFRSRTTWGVRTPLVAFRHYIMPLHPAWNAAATPLPALQAGIMVLISRFGVRGGITDTMNRSVYGRRLLRQ